MSLFGRGMSPLGRAMSPFRLHPGFSKQQNTQKGAFGPNSTKKAYLGGPRYICLFAQWQKNAPSGSHKLPFCLFCRLYSFQSVLATDSCGSRGRDAASAGTGVLSIACFEGRRLSTRRSDREDAARRLKPEFGNQQQIPTARLSQLKAFNMSKPQNPMVFTDMDLLSYVSYSFLKADWRLADVQWRLIGATRIFVSCKDGVCTMWESVRTSLGRVHFLSCGLCRRPQGRQAARCWQALHQIKLRTRLQLRLLKSRQAPIRGWNAR